MTAEERDESTSAEIRQWQFANERGQLVGDDGRVDPTCRRFVGTRAEALCEQQRREKGHEAWCPHPVRLELYDCGPSESDKVLAPGVDALAEEARLAQERLARARAVTPEETRLAREYVELGTARRAIVAKRTVAKEERVSKVAAFLDLLPSSAEAWLAHDVPFPTRTDTELEAKDKALEAKQLEIEARIKDLATDRGVDPHAVMAGLRAQIKKQ